MTFSRMIEGPDGNFGVYIAEPKSPNGAALIVIQEIFGVNASMRTIADDFAAKGYIAIVPDLFWRIEPAIELTDKTPEEMQKAFDLYGKFNVEHGISDIQTTLNFARTLANKVGGVGYCLGGFLSYMTSCKTNIDASVSYYGVSIDSQIALAQSVSKPLLIHIAGEDKFVSKQAQEAILAGVAPNEHIEAFVYEGLDHAFARPDGEHFDLAGATLANQRSSDFFARNLLS